MDFATRNLIKWNVGQMEDNWKWTGQKKYKKYSNRVTIDQFKGLLL